MFRRQFAGVNFKLVYQRKTTVKIIITDPPPLSNFGIYLTCYGEVLTSLTFLKVTG